MVEIRLRRNMPAHFGLRIVSAEKDKPVAIATQTQPVIPWE
jgi:hypothetical protein